MKKILFLFGLFCASILGIGCESHDKNITFSELPQQAQNFINSHFAERQISFVIKEDGEYEVRFNDGTKVDFSRKGEWETVDCNHLQVPQSVVALLPQRIPSYIESNFAEAFITKIERERKSYNVELNNGLELEFNSNGDFLRIDD